MGQIKTLTFYGVFLAGIILAMLVFAESTLRLLPASLTGLRTPGVSLNPHPTIGFIPKGNQSARSESACFSVTTKTNSDGFHDVEWPENLSGGIALLGDSYVWAGEVALKEGVTAQLRDRLNVPVAGAGLFSLGTFGERAVYHEFIAPRKPKTVVLFVYPGNDVTDNNCEFNKTPAGEITKACGSIGSDGTIRSQNNFYTSGGNAQVKQFIKEHCRLCKLVRDVTLSRASRSIETTQASGAFPGYEIYTSKPLPSSFRDAWTITEFVLKEFKQKVTAAGSSFSLVIVPEFVRIDPDGHGRLEREFGTTAPQDLDFEVPATRLLSFAKKESIPALDLGPVFRAYQKDHQLAYPYFSFSCDGHWNPLGHELAAKAVVAFLEKERLLSSASFKN